MHRKILKPVEQLFAFLLFKFKYHSVFAGSNLIRRYRIEP